MIIKKTDLEQDRSFHRDEIISSLLEYSQFDTVLFFSEKDELFARQEKLWQPYINWFNQEAKTSFIAEKSIIIPQNNLNQKQNMTKFLSLLSDKKLKAIYAAARELRSVILAVYLVENSDCDVAKIFEAAFLEQKFQEEFWGEMEVSSEKYAEILSNLNTIKKFLKK